MDSNPNLCTVAVQTQWLLQKRSSSSMENAAATAHGLEGRNDFNVFCSVNEIHLFLFKGCDCCEMRRSKCTAH